MELVTRVQEALASLDVENAMPHMLLGDDLGMDSQELVCLATDFERSFQVRINDDELSRGMSVLDLTTLVSGKIALQMPIGQFDHSLSEDITIAAPLAAVYDVLFDAQSWPQRLPNVRKTTMRYDDGVYQDFDMEVDGAQGGIISVHSIRRCRQNKIRFFQPSPPKFMRHHCGEWVFHPLQGGLTHLITRHEWRLADNAAELFPSQDGVAVTDAIQTWLAGHARFALTCWKSHFERGVPA